MNLKDKLSNLVTNALFDIAPIQAGVVISFDHDSNLATVRCTHRSGRGFEFFELPWTQPGHGLFLADPVPEAPGVPGTHVVLGFRGFDWNYPILLSAYDPLYRTGTRERIKRRLHSYTTRTDKTISGQL